MRLTLGDGRVIVNPTREVIEAALQALEAGGSFALMEDDAGRTSDLFIQGTQGPGKFADLFVQGIGGPDNFIVEYAEAIAEHEGEIEARHFRAQQQVTQETLVVMFQSYALGDGTWKGMVAWEDTSTAEDYDPDDYDPEEYDPEEYDEGVTEGSTSDPWARKSGCLGLLSFVGLATLGLTLALEVW